MNTTLKKNTMHDCIVTKRTVCNQSGAAVSHWPVTLILFTSTLSPTGRDGLNCNHFDAARFKPHCTFICMQFALDFCVVFKKKTKKAQVCKKKKEKKRKPRVFLTHYKPPSWSHIRHFFLHLSGNFYMDWNFFYMRQIKRAFLTCEMKNNLALIVG